jgi:hypothetical protein
MSCSEAKKSKVIMVDSLIHNLFKQFAASKNKFIQDLANEALKEKMMKCGYPISENKYMDEQTK